MRARFLKCLAAVCTCISLGLLAAGARAQTFRYEAEPRAGEFRPSYADDDPVPGMLAAREARPRPLNRYRAGPPTRGPRTRGRTISRAAYNRRPRVRRDERVLLTAQGEPIPPGTPVEPFIEDAPPGPPGSPYQEHYDGEVYEPHLEGEPFLEGPGCGGCGHCDSCCPRGQCYMRRWGGGLRRAARMGVFTENLQLITGKQGFKGPVDQGVNGDFGYHFAFNWGVPLFDSLGIGYQLGGNLIASDFEGRSSPLGSRRTQWFLTTGAFHRVSGDRGFQGGAVVDYLQDIFYIRLNLWQIRGQLSYVYCQHEVGFWGTVGTNTNSREAPVFPDNQVETLDFEATDQYTAFYRYQFCNGTFCRTWAGFSGSGDGIFGGDATAYISPRVGLIASYNYLLPRNHAGVPNNVTESWNLTISFVWYPGYNRRGRCGSWLNPYRPLFYTADNGWFFVRQKND